MNRALIRLTFTLQTHACSNLHEEQIELDGVITIHILVREKELLPESQHGGLLDPLLPQALVRVQPVHCSAGEGEERRALIGTPWREHKWVALIGTQAGGIN